LLGDIAQFEDGGHVHLIISPLDCLS